MSDEKRKNARTQGKYSGGDREFTSKRQDKQSSKVPSSADKNIVEKRKAPHVGSRVQNDVNLQYDDKSEYSFTELEPKRKPQELRFDTPVLKLSETENGISQLIYDPHFMKLQEADEYMIILQNSTAWYDKNVVIDGVEHPQPRLVAWYGPHPYSYAGATFEAKDMPSSVYEIKEKVEATLRKHGLHVELNAVLLNWYRNEKDSVAWHSDDESSLGVCPTIASVSLGETRKFEMCPKPHVKDMDPNDISYVNLTHGSLIIMDGCMQKDWKHRVPKEYHARGPRINLTFRTIFPLDQLPPEMPSVSNTKSIKSSSTKVVQRSDPKLDTENFPPLGFETNKKKTKVFSKENNGKDYKEPSSQKNSRKDENSDDEMFPCGEFSEESTKIQNNLNKKSSYNKIIDSPESQPNPMDFNSNIQESAKLNYNKLSPSEYDSASCDTYQSDYLESNDLESTDPSVSESNGTIIEPEPVDNDPCTASSGKKYVLNADAPEYVPQNKFEKYSLPELADVCRSRDDIRSEDVQILAEVVFKSLRQKSALFFARDWYELEAYEQLNDGSLTDAHLKIILERVSSMISNAYHKKNDPRYNNINNRYSNDSYRRPRQSYSRTHKY